MYHGRLDLALAVLQREAERPVGWRISRTVWQVDLAGGASGQVEAHVAKCYVPTVYQPDRGADGVAGVDESAWGEDVVRAVRGHHDGLTAPGDGLTVKSGIPVLPAVGRTPTRNDSASGMRDHTNTMTTSTPNILIPLVALILLTLVSGPHGRKGTYRYTRRMGRPWVPRRSPGKRTCMEQGP